MIFRPSSKITFVLYEDQKVSKCFQFSKKTLRFLFILLPLLVISIGIVCLFLLAYVQDLNLQTKTLAPKIMAAYQEEKSEMLQTIEQLQKQYQESLDKISTTQVAVNKDNTILPLFRPTLGHKDLSVTNILNVENIEVEFQDKEVFLKFNLLNNNTNGEKISGHIIAIMKNGPNLTFYPSEDLNFDDAITTFNMGEKFTISRFRPVVANFPKESISDSKAFFKVYIFSRLGDLLYQKSLGPVEVK